MPDMSHNPVNNVRWVPVEKVFANDYNPNAVALTELKLLYTSIKHDGYTMPLVTFHHPDLEAAGRPCFEIVDGFHRWSIPKRFRDIYDINHGLVPIVTIDKSLKDRMASTVRHNRARGKHSVEGMGTLVVEMLNQGWGDERICGELGLEKEELIRLKHVTGYAKFFLNAEYSRATETSRQIEERIAHSR